MPENNLLALQAGYKLNHYIIDKVLGQGGFGIVYKAHHEHLQDTMVIKEFLPSSMAGRSGVSVVPHTSQNKELFEDCYYRFMEEGRTLNRLNHENIVSCTDLFEANGTAYLVMKFEDGMAFSDLLSSLEATGGQYTEGQLLQVFIPLAHGLSYVHDNGVLHRDIKPGNVFIRRSDNSPVLLDFGAAKQNFAEVSQSASPYTEFYAPMDQIDTSQKPTPAIDIHAFGGMMYRAVTGKIGPFASSRSLKLARGESDPLIPSSQLAKGQYSEELLALIDQCLEFNPIKRPKEMKEVLMRLKALARDNNEQETSVDDSLNLQFDALIEMAGSDKVITENKMSFLLGKASSLGISHPDAIARINSFVVSSGWKFVEDLSEKPKLRTSKKSAPVGKAAKQARISKQETSPFGSEEEIREQYLKTNRKGKRLIIVASVLLFISAIIFGLSFIERDFEVLAFIFGVYIAPCSIVVLIAGFQLYKKSP